MIRKPPFGLLSAPEALQAFRLLSPRWLKRISKTSTSLLRQGRSGPSITNQPATASAIYTEVLLCMPRMKFVPIRTLAMRWPSTSEDSPRATALDIVLDAELERYPARTPVRPSSLVCGRTNRAKPLA